MGADRPVVLILGHRGASAHEQENTIASFRRAAAMGADGVELDVRRGFVVQHDPGPVRPGTPLLPEALDACEGMLVNVEIKNLQGEEGFDETESLSDEVVALLASRAWRDDVLVSSFNLAAINRVKQLAPEVPTGFLVMIPPDADVAGRVVDRARRHGHGAVHPHHLGVTPRLVELASSAGLAVHTWTVNDPERMRALAAMGVDSIMTDVPDVAVATLR